MITWGTVNRRVPLLLFVDTGLAGAGFTCPRSTLKEVGIPLPDGVREGIGAGGMMWTIPFKLAELALGEATEKGIQGIFGPFPPPLEKMFRFRIGGIISHEFFKWYAFTLDFTG